MLLTEILAMTAGRMLVAHDDLRPYDGVYLEGDGAHRAVITLTPHAVAVAVRPIPKGTIVCYDPDASTDDLSPIRLTFVP